MLFAQKPSNLSCSQPIEIPNLSSRVTVLAMLSDFLSQTSAVKMTVGHRPAYLNFLMEIP